VLGEILAAMQEDSVEVAICFGEHIARLHLVPQEKFEAMIRDHVAGADAQNRILAALG
jgi:hypothetical protein